jgi:hypothetical protein
MRGMAGRKIALVGLALLLAALTYGALSGIIPFNPVAETLRAIRRQVTQVDQKNAAQIVNETQPVIDGMDKTGVDINKFRDSILPGAQRGGDLKNTYGELVATANAARPLNDGIIPPPPPRPPAQASDFRAFIRFTEGGSGLVLKPPTPRDALASSAFRTVTDEQGFFGTKRVSKQLVLLNGPLYVNALGRVEPGRSDDAPFSNPPPAFQSDPDGIPLDDLQRLDPSLFPKATSSRRTYRGLAVPAANYLQLVARVCSPDETRTTYLERPKHPCSDWIPLKKKSVLCPQNLGTGEVHFLINPLVWGETGWSDPEAHIAGRPLIGGYTISTGPAPSSACAGNIPAANVHSEASAIIEGQVIHLPVNRIESTSETWQPVLASLTKPIQIRASGRMQPRAESALISGPEGVEGSAQNGVTFDVSNVWTRAKVPELPYQALIGRLCRGVNNCGTPFLVGQNALLCSPDPQSHLELWANLSDHELSKHHHYINVTRRRGVYTFEISGATAADCRK